MTTKSSYWQKLTASIFRPTWATIATLVLYGILIYFALLAASNKQHNQLSPGESIAILAILAGVMYVVRVSLVHKFDRS